MGYSGLHSANGMKCSRTSTYSIMKPEKMSKREKILLSLCLICGPACSSLPAPAPDPGGVETEICAAVDIRRKTRAAAFDEVPDFSLFGYIFNGDSVGEANYCYNEKMTKSSQYFTSEKKYPPVPSGTGLFLMGVAPYGCGGWTVSSPCSKGSPEITYTTPVSVSDQKDIIVSEYNTDKGFSGFCEMTFSHILSGIRFAQDSTASTRPGISCISLRNIYTKGTFTPGASWSRQDIPDTRSLFPNTTSEGAFDAEEQTFLILPQTMPQDAELAVTVANPSGEDTLSAPLSGTVLEKGKMYTFTLNLSGTDKPVLAVSVSEPLEEWTYSETIDMKVKLPVIPYRDSIIVMTGTGSISIPEWARYADIFMVNGGNGGTAGTSGTKAGKGGLGGKTKVIECIAVSGGTFEITVGPGGSADNIGGQTQIQYGTSIFAPDAQSANTGTGVGADGSRAPSWTGYAANDLFGASGGAGYSSSVRKGGNTGGGSGGKAGSSSSNVTNATAGTFYGAGGGGGYRYSSSKIGSAAAGYQGIAFIRFRNKDE